MKQRRPSKIYFFVKRLFNKVKFSSAPKAIYFTLIAIIIIFFLISSAPTLINIFYSKRDLNTAQQEELILEEEIERLKLQKEEERGAFHREKADREKSQKVLEGENVIDLRGLSDSYDKDKIFQEGDEFFDVLKE